MLSMIWAETLDGYIGCEDGSLPWGKPNKQDMAWFQAVTLGKDVIMGRKTFDQVGMLKGRREHIIISGTTNPRAYLSPERIKTATAGTLKHLNAVVIGGKQTYDLFMPHCTRIYRTVMYNCKGGDVKSPKINTEAFTRTFAVRNMLSSDSIYFEIWERN